MNKFLILLNFRITLAFTISNLNQEILNPFSHCAIHILTFRRVDYIPPSCPVVLTLYSLDHPINVAIIPFFNVNYNCLAHVYIDPTASQLPIKYGQSGQKAFSRLQFWYQNQPTGWENSNSCPSICSYKNGMFSMYTGQYSLLILTGPDSSQVSLDTLDAWLLLVRQTTNSLITDKIVFLLGDSRIRRLSIIQSLQTLSPLHYNLAINYQYYLIALFVPNITLTVAKYVWWDRVYYSNEPTIIANYEDDLDISYPSLDQQGFIFLTCSGSTMAGYNFQAYISIYDRISWSFILALCLLSSSLLWLGLNLTLPKEARWKTGSWDWPFRVLLEQGVATINEQPGLKRFTTRIMLGAWFLMGVILSNGYRGNNISELTSPLKISGPSTISDLMEARIIKVYSRLGENEEAQMKSSFPEYCRGDSYPDMIRSLSLPDWKEDVYQAFKNQTVLPRCMSQLGADTIFADDIERHAKLKNMIEKTNKQGSWIHITLQSPCSSMSSVSTPFSSILNAIQSCNRTSFIGWDSEVRLIRMLYYERYPEKNIFKVLRMFGLIESGLVSEWRAIHEFNQVLKIHSGEKNKSRVDNRRRVKTLAIGDNIVTVFYLLLICIGVPMISFLVEDLVLKQSANSDGN
ncbi:hypothetical protein Fcan01_15389 [Folsomia candida]|uniref:Uncharacterized protein n=1 Tax=Folsomia candida TaxID=158441 RepID=A0A226DWE4_FOLCA|nr:hypothetical protein Fcan01_15389 [Folsomia candida]